MNKQITIILIAFSIFCTELFCQESLPIDFQAFPVYVELENGSTGSGFFMWLEKGTYFVTANHVLFSGNKLMSNKAKLLSYSSRDSLKSEISTELDLKKLFEAGMIKNDIFNDVLAISLEGNDTSRALKFIDGVSMTYESSKELSIMCVTSSYVKLFKDVLIGNDMFMFGYPKSIGIQNIPQIDYRRPLIKKGIIAGKNLSSKKIILDCEVYYGNSGGLVLELDQSWTRKEYKVIGVISQFIPFAEVWDNKTHGYQNIEISNSGYSIATPIDFVILLIESF